MTHASIDQETIGTSNLDLMNKAGDCPDERRSFLMKVATAAAAVPALALSGAAPRKPVAPTARPQKLLPVAPARKPRPRPPQVPAGRNSLPNLYGGWNANNFQTILQDEETHVSFLVQALGAFARPKPNFQNLVAPNVQEFAATARILENTGVGAYLGALPLLANSPYLAAAGSIALIEARHSGYLNTLLNVPLNQNVTGSESAFDAALSPAQVVNLASPYIADLNGGPPLIPTGGLVSPIDVLNFALALEYLEGEFYILNVSRFFNIS